MSAASNDFDDVRYQHHLEHRGRTNQRIFWMFWICIASLVLIRFSRAVFSWWNRRLSRAHQFMALSHSDDSFIKRTQEFAKAIALTPFPTACGRNVSTLASGRIVCIIAYIMIVISLLVLVDAPASTSHFIDDVAFRAAWVTITQIPLAFFVSTKRGPINIVAQVSYDRLAWIHKWIGRMIFVSATTHVAIMKSSISLTDVLLSQDKGAAVVRFGIGSYLLLVWIAVSSILPVRRWSYRAFYVNHTISTLGFLMIIIQHVPKHAASPIIMAFSLVAFDRTLTISSFLMTNISVRLLKSRSIRFRRAPGQTMLVTGYPVEMLEPHNLSVSTSAEESVTTIRICNVPMTWRPGQHIRLYLPSLGALEVHPFTPANSSSIAKPPPLPPRGSHDVERRGSSVSSSVSRESNDIILMIRAHSGITRRLRNLHTEWLKLPCPNATLPSTAISLTAYVDGPYGNPPMWERYENLLLITTSSGVSFGLAIMDYLEQLCLSEPSKLATQTVRFVWIVQHLDPQFESTVAELLQRYSTLLKESGVRIETEMFVTCVHTKDDLSTAHIDQFAHLRPRLSRYGSGDRTLTIRNPDEIYDEWEEEERQWAEMEALEEMQMKEVDPFTNINEVDSCHDNNAIASYESHDYTDSETITLLDETNRPQDQRHSNSFSEIRLTSDGTMPLNQPRALSPNVLSPPLPRGAELKEKSCQCTFVQYQRQQLHKSRRPQFGNTSYATRPDITHIINSAVDNNLYFRSMVATCANSGVSREVNTAVSRAKLAFSKGQRPTTVESFTEGFC